MARVSHCWPRRARRGGAGRFHGRSRICCRRSRPALRIAACPGAPACMHGHRRVRDDATRWAAMLPEGDGVILHVSGCAKGCARPTATAATVTATDDGLRSHSRRQSGRSAGAAGSFERRGRAPSRRRRREPVCWREADVKPSYAYEKDAAAIYRRSFAIIRGEADLARFSPVEERVAVRVVHACGMVEAAARSRLLTGRCRSRARRASGRRADLLRCAHGRRRGHARPTSCEQRRCLHALRPIHARTRSQVWHDAHGGGD